LLELKKYNATNANYRLAIDILSNLKLSDNLDNSEREKLFIEDICKRVQKNGTVLYLLRDQDETFGFIALSVSSIDTFPSLQVDYIFVSEPYRGVCLKKLSDSKTSTYLIEFAIEIAKEIQDQVGLRYLVLLPDNDRLQSVYKDMGFQVLPKNEWMFIKL
jgi:GNAT superfamily N-acetyltransferase